MSKYHINRAIEIISSVNYVCIATVNNDLQPWNSPVYFAYDDKVNIYWSSDLQSQHSKNIAINSKVFLVIYDTSMAPGTGEAVYIKAEVEKLKSGSSIRKDNRFVCVDGAEIWSDTSILGIYKAKPIEIWMNDEQKDPNGKYIKDIRVSISITTLPRPQQ